jgi:drug/metabolite transporter (DMT)-like permease
MAAFVNAVASILQRLGVESAPADSALSTKLISHMFSRLVWVGGFLFMGLGFVAQATALHLGTLSVVQPLLVSELLITVVLLWGWYGHVLRRRDIVATVATTCGLAAFLALAAPRESSFVPPVSLWLEVDSLNVALVLASAVLSRRGPTWWRALALGAGASVGFAFTAAVTKPFTDAVTAGPASLVSSWATYALILGGPTSFFLMQSAFSAGPFAAS